MQYDSVRVTRWVDSGEAAGLLHLFCDKHVTYHRVYRAEEAGLPDPDTLWLTTADGFRIHTLEVKPEGEVKGAVICISGIENPSVTAFLRSRQRVPRDWTHHSNAGSPWAR